MPAYTALTSFIPELESVRPDQANDLVYQRFVPMCYEQRVLDYEYAETLKRAGITSDKLYHANVEALSLPVTLALLTFLIRADHKNDRALLYTLKSGYLLRVLHRIAELDGV